MRLYRKTAVVELVLPEDEESTLPLATERDFGVILKIADVTCPAQSFRSPINDAQWRQFYDKLRECNTNRQENMYRNATFIRSLAQHLYQSLVSVSPALRDFLGRAGEPRAPGHRDYPTRTAPAAVGRDGRRYRRVSRRRRPFRGAVVGSVRFQRHPGFDPGTHAHAAADRRRGQTPSTWRVRRWMPCRPRSPERPTGWHGATRQCVDEYGKPAGKRRHSASGSPRRRG